MRYRAIIHFLRIITVIVSLCFVLCATIDIFKSCTPANGLIPYQWLKVLSLTGIILFAGILLGKKPTTIITRKEAIATVGLTWLFIIYLGALPYHFITDQPFLNSLFESASGFTTTGATLFIDIESLPPSLLFWRALSQWLGGLGVVVLFVAFLNSLGVTGKALFASESNTQPAVDDFARIQKSALTTIGVYVSLSITFTLLLLWAGVDLFNAICHMGTALATGGFSNFNNSLGHYNDQPIVQWILIILMIIGGINFALLACFLTGKWRIIKINEELWAYLGLLFIACLMITGFLSHYDTLGTPFFNARQAILQTVSFMTSTGYGSSNYQLWPGSTQIILFLIMIIGGCSHSTAGGLKVIRFVTAWKVLKAVLRRTINPHSIHPIRLNGAVLDTSIRDSMLLYSILSVFLWCIGLALMSLCEPTLSFSGSLSTFISCWVNCGISFAELGLTNNFDNLHDSTKVLLIISMLLGRLEVYTFLALFLPGLWRRFD